MQSFSGARSALRTKPSAIEAGRVSVACPRRSSRRPPVGLIGFLSIGICGKVTSCDAGWATAVAARNERAGLLPALSDTRPSAAEERVEREGPEDAADDGGHDGDPGVPPVRASLAGYRQDGVRDARAHVASRVDRVTRGAAQREPDAQHEQAYEERGQTRTEPRPEL